MTYNENVHDVFLHYRSCVVEILHLRMLSIGISRQTYVWQCWKIILYLVFLKISCLSIYSAEVVIERWARFESFDRSHPFLSSSASEKFLKKKPPLKNFHHNWFYANFMWQWLWNFIDHIQISLCQLVINLKITFTIMLRKSIWTLWYNGYIVILHLYSYARDRLWKLRWKKKTIISNRKFKKWHFLISYHDIHICNFTY